MKLATACLVLVAACGGDDGGTTRKDASVMIDGRLVDASTIDTPPSIDAGVDALQLVQTVACGTEVKTVSTTGVSTSAVYTYTPAGQTINANDVVKFDMPSGTFHNAVPNVTGSDPGLNAPVNTATCLKFTVAGTFGFHCQFHAFTGSLTVQ